MSNRIIYRKPITDEQFEEVREVLKDTPGEVHRAHTHNPELGLVLNGHMLFYNPLDTRGVECSTFDSFLTAVKQKYGKLDIDNTKDTNPKDAVGSGKPPMSTVSAPVMREVGVAMLEGAMKYGRHNYRVAGVRTSVYYDAALRHLMAYWEGEDIDPDSGVSHLSKAIAGLTVLRDSEINNNVVDDRPPRIDLTEHNAGLQRLVTKLQDKYPEPKKAYTRHDTE